MLKLSLLLFAHVIIIDCLAILKNVDCGPHIDYEPTDHMYHRFKPFMVKLHKCIGINEENMKCVPTQTKVVKVFAYNVNTGIHGYLNMVNETSCTSVCALNSTSCNKYQKLYNKNCNCKCATRGDVNCPVKFYWDKSLCNCICRYTEASYTCKRGFKFDSKTCGCIKFNKFIKENMNSNNHYHRKFQRIEELINDLIGS